MRRIIVGISGTSGATYGVRLLERLRGFSDVETHLVISPVAKRAILEETAYEVADVEALADHIHRWSDIAAPISSGSFRAQAMVIAPCSTDVLSGIAASFSDNLLTRAADVILKERRHLLLLVEQSPLHVGHLRRMQAAAELGAIIVPAAPVNNNHPAVVRDVTDQMATRISTLIELVPDNHLESSWAGSARSPNSHARMQTSS